MTWFCRQVCRATILLNVRLSYFGAGQLEQRINQSCTADLCERCQGEAPMVEPRNPADSSPLRKGSEPGCFNALEAFGRVIRPMGRVAGIDRFNAGFNQPHIAFDLRLGDPRATHIAISLCGGHRSSKRHQRRLGRAVQKGHSIRVGRNRGGAQGEDRCGDENNLFHAILTPHGCLGSLSSHLQWASRGRRNRFDRSHCHTAWGFLCRG